MRMTVVIDDEGDGHPVLMLRTNRGDFVLNNKTDVILPWDKTSYGSPNEKVTIVLLGYRWAGSHRPKPPQTGRFPRRPSKATISRAAMSSRPPERF
jgi:hypothetical protein